MSKQQIWDLWIPDAAAQGISFARGRLGEVSILQRWWNDAEEQQWRWTVEFYNHR